MTESTELEIVEQFPEFTDDATESTEAGSDVNTTTAFVGGALLGALAAAGAVWLKNHRPVWVRLPRRSKKTEEPADAESAQPKDDATKA